MSRRCSGWWGAGPMRTWYSPTPAVARRDGPYGASSCSPGSPRAPAPGPSGTQPPGARPAPCSPVSCGARATSRSRAWATRSPYRRRPTAPPARCTAPGSPSCCVSSSASKALCSMSPAGRPAARCASGGRLRPIRDTADAAPRRFRLPRARTGARRARGRRLAAVRFPQGQSDRRARPRRHRDGHAAPVRPAAARWSAAELAGHRKAAEILAGVARDALAWVGSEAARGAEVRETGVQRRMLEAMERAGLWTNDGPIVAFGPTSAMPHYEPHPGADRRLAPGDVVLLDLWAGPGQGSVFADQTWMGFAGRSPDADVRRVWQAVKGARDAAVRFLRERWGPDGAVTGAQVDDVARAVIRDAGLADYFVHRTGHSIDRDLHGSGPHIDNFETEDARALVPGVGFSIEPGVYLPNRFGMRSEINVYIDTQGPEVNPSHPQDELILV